MVYENIPLELRERLQWVCANEDKIPINPRTGDVASVVDAGSWGSFEEAVGAGRKYIGFVLTRGDPYAIIDLDNKPQRPLDAAEYAVHERILAQFASYTERSASGRGFHIVLRGALAAGRRRGSVEVYSDARYMVFTGDVVRNAPITDCQALLDALVAQMPHAEGLSAPLVQVDGALTDRDINERAMRAENGEKFDMLCKGLWKELGYPSQSEADFALLSFLTFYTEDNAQVRRLFRYTALGKRDKAVRDDVYLDRALRKIRAAMAREKTDLGAIAADVAAWKQRASTAASPPPAPPPPPAPVPPAPAQAQQARAHSSFPRGLVGDVASYIYSSSVRPVADVSLCAALGLLAGIVGRSFNISNTGLNQYILLVAGTGVGKGDGARGIDRLVAAIRPSVPAVDTFIGPASFASGQALVRSLDTKPCFVSMMGEFGHTLRSLNDPRASSAVTLLRRVLLDLYACSGWRDSLRSTAYSDSDKNTKTLQAPCVTLLGETTPETLFDQLTHSDIADGLLPRFCIVEHTGARPARNTAAGAPPSKALAERLADLVATALTMQNNNSCAAVQVEEDALAALEAFDNACDARINSTQNEGEKQLWNRAHLKALKLAALLAVGCDVHAPRIAMQDAAWAIGFVERCTGMLVQRFADGDVGTGDSKQLLDLQRVINAYYANANAGDEYKGARALRDAGLIPYRYLSQRASKLASFKHARLGYTVALRETLKELVAQERLGIVDKRQAFDNFKSKQELYYRVLT